VTVKTRLGWDDLSKNIEESPERLQDVGIQALTIHGATRLTIKGEADWRLIAESKRKTPGSGSHLRQRGYRFSEKARLYRRSLWIDGIMIGRDDRLSLDLQ